jgi:hypothetical protein
MTMLLVRDEEISIGNKNKYVDTNMGVLSHIIAEVSGQYAGDK